MNSEELKAAHALMEIKHNEAQIKHWEAQRRHWRIMLGLFVVAAITALVMVSLGYTAGTFL